jgi:enoyl-CoA hydratase/carnithine racemase
MSPTVVERCEGRVVVATLNRPDQLNALAAQQYDELTDILDRALANDDIGAVMITGKGRAFCAGADLSLLGTDATNTESLQRVGVAFDRLLDCLGNFEKPLLAAVNGLAVGVGATLLLHCDVVVAAQSAKLRFPFTALGLVPEAGSTYLLPLIAGPQRAAELFFSAEWIDVESALELGIVRRVVPDADLAEVTLMRAQQLAAQPVSALRATKRILLDARRAGLEAARKRELAGMRAQSGSPENLAALAALARRSG